MDLAGTNIYAKKSHDFIEYQVLGRVTANEGLGLAFAVTDREHARPPVTVVFPRGVIQAPEMTDDDYVRLAVVVDRDRRKAHEGVERFMLGDADVAVAETWQAQRPQRDVLRDVLALLCEATIVGFCVPGKDFRVSSVLASVPGTREQVFEAVRFLQRQGDVGVQPERDAVVSRSALFLQDFWATVQHMKNLDGPGQV